MLERILNDLCTWITSSGIKLIIGLIILCIGWKVVKRITKTLNTILERRNVDPTISSFLDALINICLKILLLVVVMEYVGLKTTGIAALIGSAGLAVGLSLQGSLANFAGGVIILLMRPFNVGDIVECSAGTGTIEKIGIFYTYMLTADNKQILIPNGNLANGNLINYTTKETRRVDLNFTVGYEQDIRKVKQAIMEVIATEELILEEPAPFVAVDSHGDNAVGFVVKVWTKTEDYWTVHYNLLEKVKIKFDEENISIPYPQMDVHVKQ